MISCGDSAMHCRRPHRAVHKMAVAHKPRPPAPPPDVHSYGRLAGTPPTDGTLTQLDAFAILDIPHPPGPARPEPFHMLGVNGDDPPGVDFADHFLLQFPPGYVA